MSSSSSSATNRFLNNPAQSSPSSTTFGRGNIPISNPAANSASIHQQDIIGNGQQQHQQRSLSAQLSQNLTGNGAAASGFSLNDFPALGSSGSGNSSSTTSGNMYGNWNGNAFNNAPSYPDPSTNAFSMAQMINNSLNSGGGNIRSDTSGSGILGSGAVGSGEGNVAIRPEDFPVLGSSRGPAGSSSFGTSRAVQGQTQQQQQQTLRNNPYQSSVANNISSMGVSVGATAQQGLPSQQQPTLPNTSSSMPLQQQQQQQPNPAVSIQATSPSVGTGDKYGLMGLLGVIRMTDQDLNTLALGCDLTTLGLNLNSAEDLYSSFLSPWPENPMNVTKFSLPSCYTVPQIPSAQLKINSFSDETLFYIFYCMPRDALQNIAAEELYKRNWRYHKDLKLWLTKELNAPDIVYVQTPQYEKGVYIFWDVQHWCRVSKEFVVYFEMLETRELSNKNSSNNQTIPQQLQQLQQGFRTASNTPNSGNGSSQLSGDISISR